MDGFDIPIGADLGPLQEAMNQAIAAMDKLGEKVSASMAVAAAAMNRAASAMQGVATSSQTAALASQSAASGISAAVSKMERATTIGASLGHTIGGVATALDFANRASRALAGVNLAATLAGWANRMGGVRAAFAQIPAAMRAIGENPAFRRIAVGAAAAVAAIVAIRMAWRTAASGASLLATAAHKTFTSIAAGARAAGHAVSAAFSSVMAVLGLALAGPLAGLAGIAGMVGIVGKSIVAAADMETLETAFAPLLGSTEAAKKRMAELAKFAADTNFELPGVASASRVLETLTRGALSTGKGLTLVGDVAATAQVPIEEMATTVGRLYDGLQSGRPVGEAMQRLQELGAISGNTRNQIEGLQKEGAKGEVVWNVAANALHRFDGAMARQSRTFSGKLSTMRDAVGALLVKLGTPIIEGLKPWVDKLTAAIESMQDKAAKAGKAIRDALDFVSNVKLSEIPTLLGDGLSLAFIDGVNAFSSGIHKVMTFLSSAVVGIFKGIGAGIAGSGLLEVFNFLGNALAATISSAIMSAIAKVTGIESYQKAADFDKWWAGDQMDQAKRQMGNLDFGKGIGLMVEGVQKAWDDAANDSSKVGNKPLIDRAEAAGRWEKSSRPVRDRVAEERAGANDKQAAMDAQLQSSFKPLAGLGPAMEGLMKQAISPAFLSMAKFGGAGGAGGGGSGGGQIFSNILNEGKRQSGYLKRLVEQGSKSPAKMAAVFN